MPGSSNFQQWNPNGSNQETDAQYTSDSQRSAGAANPSIFASATANKLFFQLSTFVCALAQAMANKGYTLSDANLANLEAVLANVMTAADMSAYAPLLSPALTGTPTAPTPAQGAASAQIPNSYWVSTYFATLAYVNSTFAPLINAALQGSPTAPTPASTDNSTKLATTAFIKTLLAGYQPLLGFTPQAALGFTPVQQGGGANQTSNKVYIGWDGAWPRMQVDATDIGEIAMQSWVSAQGYAPESWVNANFAPLSGFVLGNPGTAAIYFKLPGGLILQFGQAGAGNGTVITLPITFPSGLYTIGLTNVGPGDGTMTPRILGNTFVSASQFKIFVYDQTGAASSSNVGWIAIGY